MGSKDDPRIKDEALYRELREEGNSKEKSARIANAAHNQGREEISEKGGEHGNYEKWTVDELHDKARDVGISHHSKMDKKALIDALRHH